MPLPRILIIEDDRSVVSALRSSLSEHYEIQAAHHAASGLHKIRNNSYAAILLDLHLTDTPGYVVCQRIRSENVVTPIIVITGDAAQNRKLQLLECGADDYLVKPFHTPELKARLNNVIRRCNGFGKNYGEHRYGGIVLDAAKHTVKRDGRLIHLRPKEFKLLECLMGRSGSVVTRETLVSHAWQGNNATWNNAIDVHIKYLRDKIDRPFADQLIHTIHGVGYCLRKPTKP